MTGAAANMPALVDELVVALDEQIALLVLKRSQLESLAGAFVQRDDQVLERLLNEMEQTQGFQADTDRKLQGLRCELADALGCPPQRLKLSQLLDELPPARRAELGARRQQVILLVKEVRLGHLQATMQLLECMRVNRMLLDGLFGQGQSVTTYDARGVDPWRDGSGLVDAEL